MWFSGCSSLDELKAEYKRLCKIHHPDLGGDLRTMQDINAEYDRSVSLFEKDSKKADEAVALREVLESLVVLQGITVELCGCWLWVTGKTFAVKEQLKSLGLFFSSKKSAWYWRPADEGYKRKRTLPLDAIRLKYGSKIFASKEMEALPC